MIKIADIGFGKSSRLSANQQQASQGLAVGGERHNSKGSKTSASGSIYEIAKFGFGFDVLYLDSLPLFEDQAERSFKDWNLRRELVLPGLQNN
jgi:hypothetical protein